MKQRVGSKGMGKGSKILLGLIIIIALLVGFGTYQFLYSQKTTVYLYKDDYPAGTTISQDMFMSTQMETSLWNAMAGTGNKYASADDVVGAMERGDCLLMDVAKLTLVTGNQFVESGGTAIESRLAKNMVSVELPVEKVTGLSAGVRIGSKLNVVVGYAVDTSKRAEMIFQDLLVVDVVTEADTGEILSVYVEVEPTESVKLIHAVMFDNVAAEILKPGSYIPVDSAQAIYRRDYTLEEDESISMGDTEGVSLGRREQ